MWYLLYLDLKSKKFSERTTINISIKMDNTIQRQNGDNQGEDDYVDKDAEVDDDISPTVMMPQPTCYLPSFLWAARLLLVHLVATPLVSAAHVIRPSSQNVTDQAVLKEPLPR